MDKNKYKEMMRTPSGRYHLHRLLIYEYKKRFTDFIKTCRQEDIDKYSTMYKKVLGMIDNWGNSFIYVYFVSDQLSLSRFINTIEAVYYGYIEDFSIYNHKKKDTSKT